MFFNDFLGHLGTKEITQIHSRWIYKLKVVHLIWEEDNCNSCSPVPLTKMPSGIRTLPDGHRIRPEGLGGVGVLRSSCNISHDICQWSCLFYFHVAFLLMHIYLTLLLLMGQLKWVHLSSPYLRPREAIARRLPAPIIYEPPTKKTLKEPLVTNFSNKLVAVHFSPIMCPTFKSPSLGPGFDCRKYLARIPRLWYHCWVDMDWTGLTLAPNRSVTPG